MSDAPDHVLDDRDIELVTQFGEGMSRQEACQWFGLDYEELLPYDRERFDRAYMKGRSNMIYYAVGKLKQQMDGRQGVQAALAALSQFAEEWTKADELAGVKQFKITID
jgi:hypothetical protein